MKWEDFVYDLPTYEANEDCISRADAIKAIESQHTSGSIAEIQRIFDADPHSSKTDFEDTLLGIFYAIQDAPSVVPTADKLSSVEDCISREGLLKYAYKRDGVMCVSVDSIKLAPSVVPSRAEGEWVIKANGNNECSICGREKQNGWVNFCGFCGAKMKGADE